MPKRPRPGSEHAAVSFLLFSDGRADPEEWRPNADESMWWGRRDALARIAAAALRPAAQPEAASASCTVLLADDNSLLRIDGRLQAKSGTVPTEEDLVRSVRRAITGCGALGTACIKEPWKRAQLSAGGGDALGKRELLEQLQRRMPLEFLRVHGLNKSPAQLLKSCTRQQLLDAWEAAFPSHEDAEDALSGAVKCALAQLPKGGLVVILHEDCSADLPLFDLPLFEEPADGSDALKEFSAVLFVLGAVRDMRPAELRAVERAAKGLELSTARLRLGQVPEFSSKVVRCIAAAHLHGLVMPAVARAVAGTGTAPEAAANGLAPLALTVFCAFPKSSEALSLERNIRGELLPLVQLCVCTLWRSKIGDRLSSDEGAAREVEPKLWILFNDGLSSSHKAAPTERQVLEALQQRLRVAKPKSDALRRAVRSCVGKSSLALMLSEADGFDLFQGACSGKWMPDHLLLLVCPPPMASAAAAACREESVPLAPVAMARNSAPSAVVLLQFMHYCGSLAPRLRHLRRTRLDAESPRMLAKSEVFEKASAESARALVEQLAPTMAAIANVMYHRDVNAHNILAHVAPGGQLSFGLVDFGLAVDASTWMDPSPLNPGGKSEWEFLDVGGDCRYWPVSAWRQFEAGCRALVEEEPLCTEYQTHLDLQGLGLTAVQVLVCLLPKRHAELVLELRLLQEAWQKYWEEASCYWAALLETFRHGGDWVVLKQEFVARGVHKIIASRLEALRETLGQCLCAAAAANLGGGDTWPRGSAGLFWALLAMVSSGESMGAASWQDVCMRLRGAGPEEGASKHRQDPNLPDVKAEAQAAPEAPQLLGYLCKLRALAAKARDLSLEFEKLVPMGEVA
ncbi:unnamed protein product [Effrenium voratum]|uniref:Protein kinase domain-containing protein n=1 Tax=Effrenium voratum TaxID=2562239 RepID=A0AA36I306_9DINO|nr:unnamed protein product [Effrenium voratum]